MEVEGQRIRYWESGSGPLLLVLHGLGNSVLTWRSNIEALSQRFRTVALDLPGHGLSDMPVQRFDLSGATRFLMAFMEAIGGGPAYVVGNSMGGIIALELALKAPERVRKLVLVDSVGLGKEIAWFLRLGSVPGIGEYYERPSPQRITNLCRTMVYDRRFVEEDVVAEMYRYRKRPGAPRALLQFLRVGVGLFGQRRAIGRREELSSLRMPLMVVWGRQDKLVPAAHAEAVLEAVPDARVHIFDECGHWPQVEHAEQFNSLVAEFLSEAEGRVDGAGPEAQVPEGDIPPRVSGGSPLEDAASGDAVTGEVNDSGDAQQLVVGGDGGAGPAAAAQPTEGEIQWVSRGQAFIRRNLRLIILALVIAVVLTVVFQRDRFTDVESFVDTVGYPGIFLLSLAGSGAIVLPLPSTAAIIIGGIFLTPVYVGLIAGVAEAMGEVTGYALGYSGQGIVEKNRFYKWVERWLQLRGWLAIMLFSAIPNPLFDLLGVAAGVLRYPLKRFLVYTWIGKTVKNVGLAYLGFFGVEWALDLFNISVSSPG